MTDIVKKPPLYRIKYAEPFSERFKDGQCVYCLFKTIIVDFESWKTHIPDIIAGNWTDEKIKEKWEAVIDTDRVFWRAINREFLTGQVDVESGNVIYCEKMSVELVEKGDVYRIKYIEPCSDGNSVKCIDKEIIADFESWKTHIPDIISDDLIDEEILEKWQYIIDEKSDGKNVDREFLTGETVKSKNVIYCQLTWPAWLIF